MLSSKLWGDQVRQNSVELFVGKGLNEELKGFSLCPFWESLNDSM